MGLPLESTSETEAGDETVGAAAIVVTTPISTTVDIFRCGMPFLSVCRQFRVGTSGQSIYGMPDEKR
jgi:hypothetical protein